MNKLIFFSIALMLNTVTYSQVAMGTTTPATSAVLDLTATEKALLLPRVANIGTITSPVNGMMVYDELNKCVRAYNNNSWGAYCLNGKAVLFVGVEFSNHFNGIVANASVNHTLVSYTTGETFNNNTQCAQKPISVSPCNPGQTVTGASGTVYNTVNINGQCWLKENLKELPGGVAINATQWLNTTPGDQGFYGYYNTIQDGTAGWRTTEVVAGLGILYQWSAAMNGSITERAQGVCPTGFHIPSDCEWKWLEHGIGMSISEQNNFDTRSSVSDSQGTPGYKLRSQGTGATNESGFTGLLAGFRTISGLFRFRTTDTTFYSSTLDSSNLPGSRWVLSGGRGVIRNFQGGDRARSVRCIKD